MELKKHGIRLVLATLILFGATVGIYEVHEAYVSHSAAVMDLQQQQQNK